MKNRILAVILTACVLCFAACVPTEQTGFGIIDGELPAYEHEITAAYGELPDLDVIIDGKLDESLWKGLNYISAENEADDVAFYFTAAFSEKGLYIGAYSSDKKLVYAGRNYFSSNSNISFVVASAKGHKTLRMDAVNLKPTQVCMNARSAYEGELDIGDYNNPTVSKGMSIEAFITWDELGYEACPEYIDIRPYYVYRTNYYGINLYLNTTSNNEFARFTAGGYEHK